MDDLISRQAVLDAIFDSKNFKNEFDRGFFIDKIRELPSAEKIGHCKDCKYFEYDSIVKVYFCKRWSDVFILCITKEDGYCFLFEPQESEDKNEISRH